MSNTTVTTSAWPDDFDRRVFISHDPGVIEVCGEGQIYFGGPIDGPTNVYIGPAASDAAVQRIAARFEISADAVRSFRDSSAVGEKLELGPTSIACRSEAHAAA